MPINANSVVADNEVDGDEGVVTVGVSFTIGVPTRLARIGRSSPLKDCTY